MRPKNSDNAPLYGIYSRSGGNSTLLYQYPRTRFFAEAARILKKAKENSPRATLKIDIVPEDLPEPS